MTSEARGLKPEARGHQSVLRPLFLAGPTAVGKSDIALHLAGILNGEIISVDSMQVYRGLNIGTAKPSRNDQALASHHLIDVVELNQSFDAAQFVTRARQAVVQIQSRRRRPILCGGTGLYFKAFQEGLGDAPAGSATLRAELEATPLSELLRELERRDPQGYAGIDRSNPRRVVRAVEVIRLTGQPFSQQRAQWNSKQKTQNCEPLFGFRREPADLNSRIETRVQQMFDRGLVAETEALLKRGLAENRTAAQALGYRQVLEHLHGARSLVDTIELVKIRTRQFAKRQMTWFKNQMALEWIDLSPSDAPETVASRVAAMVTARP